MGALASRRLAIDRTTAGTQSDGYAQNASRGARNSALVPARGEAPINGILAGLASGRYEGVPGEATGWNAVQFPVLGFLC
jgi:hypothetical protein